MKRLLAISWAMPPILKPRSLQVARLLKGLSELGWQVDVISIDPKTSITARPLDPSLEHHYEGAFNVFRLRGARSQVVAITLGKLSRSLRPVPDAEYVWMRTASRFGLNLSNKVKYSAVASFAQPWSSHLVAQNIHSSTGLPWLAHFSDPWADNPYYTNLTQRQLRKMLALENEVVRSADAVVFTNSQTAETVMRKYPKGLGLKASILPHSFDASLLPLIKYEEQEERFLTLVYAGTLYGLRSAENLIKALAQVKRRDQIRLQIVGAVNEKQRYLELSQKLGVAHLVEFPGHVSYQKSLELLSRAGALVLIDAPSTKSLFLPSKLIDYLMFGKCILGITPTQGASAEVLRSLECPVVAPDNIPGILYELERFLDLWRRKNLTLPTSAQASIRRFSSEHLAREFESMLESLSHRISISTY